jgi:hypothetical protein
MKNKYITYTIMLVLILALSVSGAFAASFTADDITFTPLDGKRGQTVTQQLHLVNTGTDALTLSITSSIPSLYQAVLGQTSVDIAAGASVDVPVTIYVPLSQDSGTQTISGGITVTATNVAGLSDAVSVSVATASMLEISKVQLEFDGDTHTVKDGSTYDEDLKAGTSINIIVKVSNEFSGSEDYEIQDIGVEIEGSGDLDLDDSDDMSDLDQGDDDTVTFSAEIPSDAEDGDDYDIDITVTGEDENGAIHEDKYSATIEVKRESHELTITDVTFNPNSVLCSGKVTMNIDIENTGKYDEDNVNILVVSQGLDIEQSFYEATLDRDDTVRKSFTFNIDSDVKPGDYDFMITSYYDVDEMSDAATATLTVEECQKSTTTTTQPGTAITTPTQPTMPQVVPTGGATAVYGTASFTDSPTYLVILVAAVIVLLAILIILLVKFVF